MGEQRVLSSVRAALAHSFEKSRQAREGGQIRQILDAFQGSEELTPYQIHERTLMNFGRINELLVKMAANGLLTSEIKRSTAPDAGGLPQFLYKKAG